MYGRATDTPRQLTALIGNNHKLIDAANYHLGSAIVHQGTIAMAAVPVLDFLLNVMTDGRVTDAYAQKVVTDWLTYLAESVWPAEEKQAIELKEDLLDQLETFAEEAEAAEFLEAEGFELYENTYYWANEQVISMAPKVVLALKAAPWSELARNKAVLEKWQELAG